MAIRVTGGVLRGRQLRVPAGAVRPTQDRVRAAVFSMLGASVAHARVLDLFAGTGVLGLEAYSRGAALAVWVERQRRVWANLCENIRALSGAAPAVALDRDGPATGLVCICDDVLRFLSRRAAAGTGLQFDLVFADPPYERDGALLKKLLPALAPGSILHPNAGLVLEQPSALAPLATPGWDLLRDRRYGETRVCIYRRAAAGE